MSMTVGRRKRRRERGQALVEFALLAPLLVILVFGIVDIARLFHAWVTVQASAREGARYGVTGRTDCNIVSPSRLACIEHLAEEHAGALTNQPTDLAVSVRSWQYPSYANPATEGNPGDQCDALEVQVDYDFTAATPLLSNLLGPVHLKARERLVNEPFGPCQ